MDSFSYTDTVRAAFASCLPCFSTTRSGSVSNPPSSAAVSAGARPSSSTDLAHLLRDSDSDALSLHSNLGTAGHRRARHRRRPKFSLTLFGYTLFGRPPIYLADDDDDDDGDDPRDIGRRRVRASITNSTSTLDSDAAPLDASIIERLTSPDHFAALTAQREAEQSRLEAEEDTRRKAERRARRQARKARERSAALMSLTGASPRPDVDDFEGFQGSGMGPTPIPFHEAAEIVPARAAVDVLDRSNDPHSGEGDDADLGGELYARPKKASGSQSGSGSESRSRTSASFSAGDTSHIHSPPTHTIHQSIPYPHTEMHLPGAARKKPRSTPKRASTVSSGTSQSTSTAPYTPVESITESLAVAAFPVPAERYLRDRDHADFPSAGLSGSRKVKSLDPRAFLAQQG